MIPISEELGISITVLSSATTVAMAAIALSMPVLSKIYAKYESKKLMTLAVTFVVLSLAIKALASSVVLFYIATVLQGIAFGITYNLAPVILTNKWFKKKAGTVLSLIALVGTPVCMVFTSLGGWFIDNHGWRACLWMFAAVTVVLCIPCLLLIKNKPEDMGLLPYGYESEGEKEGETKVALKGLPISKAVKSLAFWAMGLAVDMMAIANTFSGYLASYVQDMGYSITVSGFVSTALLEGGMASKLFIGPMLDKKPSSATCAVLLCGLVSVLALIVLGKAGVAVIIISAALFGVSYDGMNVCFAQVVREMFGDLDYEAIFADSVVFISVFGALVWTIFGVFVDLFGFASAPYVSIICFVLCIAMLLLAVKDAQKKKSEWEEK